MIDILGKTIDNVQKPKSQQFIATVDLDRTLIHANFNEDKVARLLREHAKGEVELERSFDMESWNLLRAVKPGCARPRRSRASNTRSRRSANIANAVANNSTNGGRRAKRCKSVEGTQNKKGNSMKWKHAVAALALRAGGVPGPNGAGRAARALELTLCRRETRRPAR